LGNPGSVRASLEWSSFCELKIPLPSLEKQRSIVAIYNAMQTQKNILQKLKDKLVPLCPVLVKGAEIE
jgi:type I restriction enzyme S subunit